MGGRRGFVCLRPNVRTQRVAVAREAGEVRKRGMDKIRGRLDVVRRREDRQVTRNRG